MRIRRLGIIGDVHGAARHLEAALRFFQGVEVDQIVCVGDITDGPGDAGRCCELLQQYQVPTVRGNHERWFLDGTMRELTDITPPDEINQAERAYLLALPPTLTQETVAGRLLLCHGMGANDMQGLNPYDEGYALECNMELQQLRRSREFRFVVCGHTHRRMVRQIEQLTFINPGPLREIYGIGESGIAVADFAAGNAQFYDFVDFDLAANSEPVPL